MSPRIQEYSPAQLLDMAKSAMSEEDFEAAGQFVAALPSQLTDSQIKSAEVLLLHACSNGRKEIVEMLLGNGADINTKDRYCQTGLILAVINDHNDIVETLLAKGADVNAKDHNDRTALVHACIEGRKEIVETLLSNGADINARTENGNTALIFAVQSDKREMVEALIAKGVDMNASGTVLGHTALTFAVRLRSEGDRGDPTRHGRLISMLKTVLEIQP